MPELPEVETLRRELARKLVGKTIKTTTVWWPKTVLPLTPKQFDQGLRGQTIQAIDRRAKMLILCLENGEHLLVHLKMTGQLIYQPAAGRPVIGGHPQKNGEQNLPNKFTRLALEFADQSKLFFNDLRKFGWLKLASATTLARLNQNFGPEPLGKDFTPAKLTELIKRYPKRKIKTLLLDQKSIAGLGNIYVDEACFLAKILPARLADRLTKTEQKKLYEGIKRVLKLAILKKGTSSRNYVRSDGQLGNFVPYLNVYGRAGAKCKRCQTGIIKKIKQNGRGTHFCPNCQQWEQRGKYPPPPIH